MSEKESNAKIDDLSFEAALAELEQIVEALEQGNVPLDKSIEHYERGEKLRTHCQSLLSAAEDKVNKIKLTADGQPIDTEPLD